MERYRSAAEIINRNITLDPSSKILDVGSGHGHMKRFFDDQHGVWWGIETWEARAKRCRKLGYHILNLDLDREPLPFPADHFDVVIASHVIEHLCDSGATIRELARLTKPSGLLLVATPTKPPLFAGLVQAYHRRLRHQHGQTFNAFTAASLKRHVAGQLAMVGKWDLVDGRGFRVLSARSRTGLENWYWFYRANLLLARALPWLVPEVNLIFRNAEGKIT